MAFCSICGDSCGLATAHPECETRVALGVPPEKVRAEVKLALGLKAHVGLYASSRSVAGFAGIFFPILIVLGWSYGYSALGNTDSALMTICGSFGALCGGLLAALLYHWFKMQALLAHRIAGYLDSH
jgi:hypothetical protein